MNVVTDAMHHNTCIQSQTHTPVTKLTESPIPLLNVKKTTHNEFTKVDKNVIMITDYDMYPKLQFLLYLILGLVISRFFGGQLSFTAASDWPCIFAPLVFLFRIYYAYRQ